MKTTRARASDRENVCTTHIVCCSVECNDDRNALIKYSRPVRCKIALHKTSEKCAAGAAAAPG